MLILIRNTSNNMNNNKNNIHPVAQSLSKNISTERESNLGRLAKIVSTPISLDYFTVHLPLVLFA